jgi:hypothetical protein
MSGTLLKLLLVFSLAAGFAPVALADYYQYTDANGTVNISNKLESVPQKYRSRMKLIREETLTKQDQGARKQAAPEAAREESGAPQESAPAAPAPAPAPQGMLAGLSAHAWFKPMLYVVGFFAALMAVIKLTSVIPSALLSKLIYLSFFIGVFVLMYKAYIEHVVADSLAVKEKAVTMMKKASEREIPLPGEGPGK